MNECWFVVVAFLVGICFWEMWVRLLPRSTTKEKECVARIKFYESVLLDPNEAIHNDEFRTWPELSDDVKQVWKDAAKRDGYYL